MTGFLSFLKKGSLFLPLMAMLSVGSSCNQIDDDRIPSLPVYNYLSGAVM